MRKPKERASKRPVFFILLAALLLWPLAGAWATFIVPKRVMIEDKQRASSMIIMNRSKGPLVYSFEWQRRAQSPTGESLLLEDGQTTPGYRPADDMLSFSPRQIIVPAGGSQKIRIVANRPADLADGEYHSHILIKADPLPTKKDAEKSAGSAQPSASTAIKLVSYTAIPVFVRQGATSINLNLTRATLSRSADGKMRILFSMANNSTRSIYVMPTLECTDSTGAIITKRISTTKVYTEAKTVSRDAKIPDDFPLAQCSTLKLSLSGVQDFEFNKKIIDEIDVTRTGG